MDHVKCKNKINLFSYTYLFIFAFMKLDYSFDLFSFDLFLKLIQHNLLDICCNDFSIGIELEGTDEIPYEPVQYKTLQALIKLIRECYPAISEKDIVGHCHIAAGRKTDPGPVFEWAWLGIEPQA